MCPIIRMHARKMSRTVTGVLGLAAAAHTPAAASPREADIPGGRQEGRDGSHPPSTRISRREISRLAAAMLCWLCGPGLAFSQTNYIPQTIGLVGLNGNQICVVGSSIAPAPPAPPVLAYYLQATGTAGTWTQVPPIPDPDTGFKVPAQLMGSGNSAINAIRTSPGNNPATAISSARLYFFITPIGVDCSTIFLTITNINGTHSIKSYPYPAGLFEYTTDLNHDINGYLIHADVSNVDNTQVPVMWEVYNGAQIYAQLGNSVYSPHMAITTAITGPNFAGGTASPFVTWLNKNFPNFPGATVFQRLALPATTAAPAMIQSPTAYLSNLNDALNDPLAKYFDDELRVFFANAFGSWHPLSVMGDATAPIPQGVWTATSKTAKCPIYINHGQGDNDGALQMTLSVPDNDGHVVAPIVICNPLGSVVPFADPQPSITIPTPANPVVQLQISLSQYNTYYPLKDWYFGQPKSGFAGTPSFWNGPMPIQNPNPAACKGNPCITFPVTCGTACPNPDATMKWAFSNIDRTKANPWESATQMVFARSISRDLFQSSPCRSSAISSRHSRGE
jgi:hypothetical protein